MKQQKVGFSDLDAATVGIMEYADKNGLDPDFIDDFIDGYSDGEVKNMSKEELLEEFVEFMSW